MASKEDRGNPIPYDFNKPLYMVNVADSLLHLEAKEEMKEECRNKPKKVRDDES